MRDAIVVGGAVMNELDYAHPPLPQVRAIIQRALEEDIGWGDVTTDNSVPADQRSRGVLLAKQEGVLCGGRVFAETLGMVNAAVTVDLVLPDGAAIAKGSVVARLEGPTRALLTGERTALNFVQRLSGIATATAAFVARLHGLPTRLVDTRKTTPGLRALEKYAVRCGGGFNHRFGLDDAVLIKDNHIAVAGGIRAVLTRAKAAIGHLVKIEIEVDSLDQLNEVLDVGMADVVLIDNFDLAAMRKAVALVAGRLVIEASGGITLESAAAIAETGVDYLSSGSLTHSVQNLDIGLDIEM